MYVHVHVSTFLIIVQNYYNIYDHWMYGYRYKVQHLCNRYLHKVDFEITYFMCHVIYGLLRLNIVTELASARLLSVTFLVSRHENRFMSDDRIWNMLCQL